MNTPSYLELWSSAPDEKNEKNSLNTPSYLELWSSAPDEKMKKKKKIL